MHLPFPNCVCVCVCVCVYECCTVCSVIKFVLQLIASLIWLIVIDAKTAAKRILMSVCGCTNDQQERETDQSYYQQHMIIINALITQHN